MLNLKALALTALTTLTIAAPANANLAAEYNASRQPNLQDRAECEDVINMLTHFDSGTLDSGTHYGVGTGSESHMMLQYQQVTSYNSLTSYRRQGWTVNSECAYKPTYLDQTQTTQTGKEYSFSVVNGQMFYFSRTSGGGVAREQKSWMPDYSVSEMRDMLVRGMKLS